MRDRNLLILPIAAFAALLGGGFPFIAAVALLHAEENAPDYSKRLALAREFGRAYHLNDYLAPILLDEISGRDPGADENKLEFEILRRSVISKIDKYIFDYNEMMVIIFARYYSSSELEDLLHFYNSPSGTALAAHQWELERRSDKLLMEWLMKELNRKRTRNTEGAPEARDRTAILSETSEVGKELAAVITQPRLAQFLKDAENPELEKRLPELIDSIGALYTQTFTRQDIGEIVKFFRSRTGAKLLTNDDASRERTSATAGMVTKMFNDARQSTRLE
jgi:hypothetical protein